MVLEELPKCKAPTEYNPYMGQPIPPLDRLKIMSEDDFEDLVVEWANGYVHNNYYKVSSMAGAGDKGRDVVAYYDDKTVDIYQCKHYKNPLSPSQYWVEFGKLCYYTYIGEYAVPNKYYIVASNGIGQSLRKLIEHPKQINTELINIWDEKCGKKRQIIAEGIKMTDSLRKYIEEFDFSIVSDIAPITLLDEFSKSPWYKYHFGGGIKKRPTFEKPSEQLKKSEKTMPYVKQLLKVYSKEAGQVYETQEDLKNNQKLYKHFMRQREGFFSAQSLKRFARDELLNEDSYNSLKGQVEFGIMDVYENEYSSELERVKETTKQANSLGISCEEIKDVTIYDKTGMCHELVNDEKIIWSDIDENI